MTGLEYSWVFQFRGLTWTTDDLTFDELETVEGLTGVGWKEVSPMVAGHVPAILFVFLTRTLSDEEAKAMVTGLRVKDIRVSIKIEVPQSE